MAMGSLTHSNESNQMHTSHAILFLSVAKVILIAQLRYRRLERKRKKGTHCFQFKISLTSHQDPLFLFLFLFLSVKPNRTKPNPNT